MTRAGTTKFGPKVWANILERIAGGEPVKGFCNGGDYPSFTTFWARCRDDPAYAAAYVFATQVRAHGLAEEALSEVVNAPEGADSRLVRIKWNARCWHAGKMYPQVYGNKTSIEHMGKLGIETMTPEQVDAKLAELLGKAGLGAAFAAQEDDTGEE